MSRRGGLDISVDDKMHKVTIDLIGTEGINEVKELISILKKRITHDTGLNQNHYKVKGIVVTESALPWVLAARDIGKRAFVVNVNVTEGKREKVKLTLADTFHILQIDCTTLREFLDHPLNVVAIKTLLEKYFTDPTYWRH